MLGSFENVRTFWHELSSRITLRRDLAPIDSVARLNDFVSTRAAFIAQKTLYGYLKTRMGIRYPNMFDDDAFVHSINIAKFHVFAACLSDLAIHAIALATYERSVTDDIRYTLALDCYETAMAENALDVPDEFSPQTCSEAFRQRLNDTDWAFGARQPDNFTHSPRALFEWAPIAPELKRLDEEIVENSIKFAWRDIRLQLDKRLDAASIYTELSDRQAT